ncbi:unnamed protein product, partial [Protopolystoma xenopodis]
GEDGLVKTQATSVYSLAWNANSSQIVYASGQYLIIQSLQASIKALSWKAHEGVILKLDWNPINELILSGAEDGKYKIWDGFGRQLYSSSPCNFPITSVAWSPDGLLFAIGSYNMLRLCDQQGWTYSIDRPSSGSILNLAWSCDGTQIVGAGAAGHVVLAQVIDRCMEYDVFQVTLRDEHSLSVYNAQNGAIENLELRDRVIKISFCFDYLIVLTATQCHIYNTASP